MLKKFLNWVYERFFPRTGCPSVVDILHDYPWMDVEDASMAYNYMERIKWNR